MISRKLIAPMVGAMMVPCAAGLTSAPAAGKSASTSTLVRAPSFGDAVVSSRLLRRNVLVGQRVTVAGMLAPTLASEHVTLQQRGRRGWHALRARSGLASAGSFSLSFRELRLGRDLLRLQVSGADGIYDTPATRLDVFHRVLVSWYGLTGRTACGSELTATTLGVANRALPCGTLVTFVYRGRVLRVPVIDRGPYVNGRDYDLTYATKRALGAHDLTMVWADH